MHELWAGQDLQSTRLRTLASMITSLITSLRIPLHISTIMLTCQICVVYLEMEKQQWCSTGQRGCQSQLWCSE